MRSSIAVLRETDELTGSGVGRADGCSAALGVADVFVGDSAGVFGILDLSVGVSSFTARSGTMAYPTKFVR